jgi:hypothetical protein
MHIEWLVMAATVSSQPNPAAVLRGDGKVANGSCQRASGTGSPGQVRTFVGRQLP